MINRFLFIGSDLGSLDPIAVVTTGTMIDGLPHVVDMRILPAEEPKPAFDLDIRLPREKPRRDWEQRARRRRK